MADWFDQNSPALGQQNGGMEQMPQGTTSPYQDFGMNGSGGNVSANGTTSTGGWNDQILNSPSYQFQLSEGTRGIQNSAAAQGTLLTGGTLKALSRFNQGLASSFDDKYWNRNYSLATLGQNAASNVGSAGMSYGQSAGDTYTQQGNAQAAGTVGVASSINNGLNQYLKYNQGGYGASSYSQIPSLYQGY